MSAPSLLLTGPNAPNVKTVTVKVPAGHVLPDGRTVKRPFTVVVQAGARWHPDWNAPRYSVIAWRHLAMGDAIGFSGDKAAAFPLPNWMAVLAKMHGSQAVNGERVAIGADGDSGALYVPFKPEKITDFLLPPKGLH